jgi:diacylglycerol kinase (ATP)
MASGEDAAARPALGVLPAGTGNDLARTLALPLGAPTADALALLARGPRRALDLIHVSGGPGGNCYAVNACSGGFTDQVDEEMTPGLKQTWGPMAYAIGAARALPDIERYRTMVACDDEDAERVHAFNVLIANGRSIGGGTPVAPMASLEDGLLDVVVVREGGALDIARLTMKAYTTGYTEDAQVLHRRVREVRVASEPGMWFNVDGEPHTDEPLTFRVVPGALRVVVGPDYVAHPE